MNNDSDCLMCARSFCESHTPKFGDVIRIFGLSIYVGTMPVVSALFDRFILGLKPVKYWMGTDVLEMYKYPPYKNKAVVFLHRAKMWLLNWIIYQHWFVSENLFNELLHTQWFPIRAEWLLIKKPPPKIMTVSKKIQHKGFNILVYRPKRELFDEWLYGYDIIKWLKNEFIQVNWIEVDGNNDMEDIYPVVDAYIRPSRHDGDPLMIQECKLFDIPVWWSRDGEPEYYEIEAWLMDLLKLDKKKRTKKWETV